MKSEEVALAEEGGSSGRGNPRTWFGRRCPKIGGERQSGFGSGRPFRVHGYCSVVDDLSGRRVVAFRFKRGHMSLKGCRYYQR